MSETMVGHVVRYEVGGVVVLWGVAEYVRGAWVGVRGQDGRLDEVPAALVVADDT